MAIVPTAGPAQPGAPHLVLLAQQGDGTAFGLLYRDCARVVHGILLGCCGRSEADDLTQDVFMQAFERLPELRDPAAFPAWLCAIARHAGIDHLRQRQRRPVATELAEVEGREHPPGESFAPQDEWERILLGLATDCGVSLSHSALSSEGMYE